MKIHAPLVEKTANYIKDSLQAQNWLNVLEGGIRAGKNVANTIAFGMIVDEHEDMYHAVCGPSIASAVNNIVDCNGYGLEAYFKGRCKRGKVNNRDCLKVQTIKGNKIIYTLGLKDTNTKRFLLGYTFGSIYITEPNMCNLEAVNVAVDRTTSSSSRKIFMDLNPTMPKHPFYTEFLDVHMEKQKEDKQYGLNYQHMTIFDNLSISDEKLKKILSTYKKNSERYRSVILGKRASTDGRIYEEFDETVVCVSSDEINEVQFSKFCVGIDIGIGNSATCAILLGFTRNYETIYVLDGYYEKQGGGVNKRHNEDYFAKKVVNQIQEWGRIDRRIVNDTYYFSDSGLFFFQDLRNELEKAGIHKWDLGACHKLTINKRIEATNRLIEQDRLKINKDAEGLQPLIEAFYSAIWDSKEIEKGKFTRLDDGSYSVDSLDAFEYGFTYYMRELTE